MHRAYGLLLLASVLGCGQASGPALPKLYGVSGILTIGDKPAPDIAVQLIPIDTKSEARPAAGTTGTDGRFVMSTNGKLGATPGKYKVVLGAFTSSKPLSHEEYAKISGAGVKTKGMPKPKTPFPEAWTRPSSSPLEHEVVDKSTTIEITL